MNCDEPTYPKSSYLAFIHDATVRMHFDDPAVGVHVVGMCRAPQPDTLTTLQQDVQVVVVVVVQTRRRSCQPMILILSISFFLIFVIFS
jgi:hypothetical protein